MIHEFDIDIQQLGIHRVAVDISPVVISPPPPPPLPPPAPPPAIPGLDLPGILSAFNLTQGLANLLPGGSASEVQAIVQLDAEGVHFGGSGRVLFHLFAEQTPYLQGSFLVRMRPDGLSPGERVVVTAASGSVLEMPAFSLGIGEDGVAFASGSLELTGVGIVPFEVRGTTVLQLGQWYTLAVVWDPDYVWLYVDGVLEGTVVKNDGTHAQITADDYFQGIPPDALLPVELGAADWFNGAQGVRFVGTLSHAVLSDAIWNAGQVLVAHAWASSAVPPPPPPPPPPTSLQVMAGVDFTSGVHGVTFTPLIQGGTPPYSQMWDYGDGSFGESNLHTYVANGTYTARLSVVDNAIPPNTANDEVMVTVQHDHPPPPLPSDAQFIVTTHGDRVTRFVTDTTVTLTSTRDGDANDPATWAEGRVPVATDYVRQLHAVPISGVLAVHSWEVGAGARCDWKPGMELRLNNFQVLLSGHLHIDHNPALPCRTIVRDVLIDTTRDPEQWGAGVMVFGKLTSNRASRVSFLRLATAPVAGDTSLRLEGAATGWRVGDQLLITDSRQLNSYTVSEGVYVQQNETPKIQSVSADGMTVTLDRLLQYDHPSAFTPAGVETFRAHCANLSQDCTIESENPNGTRGHFVLLDRAEYDFAGIGLIGLGRTSNWVAPPWESNASFDANGNLIALGLNQQGRYPLHTHHSRHGNGPRKIENCCVYDWAGERPYGIGPKWPITVHGSHGVEVRGCVTYNYTGSGITLEDGNERDCVIENNLVVHQVGQHGWNIDGIQTSGTHLSGGIWARGYRNRFRNNVVASCKNAYGLLYFGKYLHDNLSGILEESGNEFYNVWQGWSAWWLGDEGAGPLPDALPSLVQGMKVWHHRGNAYEAYHTNLVTLDGLVVRGDPSGVEFNQGVGGGDYASSNLVVRNSDIQGCNVGFQTPQSCLGTQLLLNNVFCCRNDIVHGPMNTSHSFVDFFGPRRVEARGNIHLPWPGLEKAEVVNYTQLQSNVNHIQLDQLFVYDHNAVVGDNFQVFKHEQLPDYVLPDSVTDSGGPKWNVLGGPPQAPGITNQQGYDGWAWAWDPVLEGIGFSPVPAVGNPTCMSGEIAPTGPGGAVPRARIGGLVKAF